MKTVTTQQTAKKFKLITILCNLALVVSPIWAICLKCEAELNGGDPNFVPPIVAFVVAILCKLLNRFLTWWNHG